MRTCPNCGAILDTTKEECPNCAEARGADSRAPWPERGEGALALFIFFGLPAILALVFGTCMGLAELNSQRSEEQERGLLDLAWLVLVSSLVLIVTVWLLIRSRRR
jgi:hypothetical protein